MLTVSSVLENTPSEAWVGLAGVLFGSLLTTFGVWLTNRANTKQLKQQLEHDEKLSSQRIAKERLEELYVLVCRWLNVLFGNYLNLTLVMKDEIDYNQYLDTFLKSENKNFDFSRLEMIIGIYGVELKELYEQAIQARSLVNTIVAEHKAAYKRGESGLRFLEPFTSAQIQLEDACERLKLAIANSARNA